MYEASVVMATYNRIDLLRSAIDSLFGQRDVSFEVIVVDDGSSDGTMQYLENASRTSPIPFQFLQTPENSGPAVARNLGWPLAAAPFVAFTDDDCEADPGWLRSLLDHADNVDIVQGRTVPNPNHPVVSCWNRTVKAEKFSDRYHLCNLLVRKSVLVNVGGFDETFDFAGEDSDFGWRARKAGHTGTYCADGLVLHALRPLSFVEYLRMRRAWAELVKVYKRHPQTREWLYRRLFFRQEHFTVIVGTVLALVGGFAFGPWAAPLLYGAYVARIAQRHKFPGNSWTLRLKYALVQPLAEAWEIVHFAIRSIRHRTLVL